MILGKKESLFEDSFSVIWPHEIHFTFINFVHLTNLLSLTFPYLL